MFQPRVILAENDKKEMCEGTRRKDKGRGLKAGSQDGYRKKGRGMKGDGRKREGSIGEKREKSRRKGDGGKRKS